MQNNKKEEFELAAEKKILVSLKRYSKKFVFIYCAMMFVALFVFFVLLYAPLFYLLYRFYSHVYLFKTIAFIFTVVLNLGLITFISFYTGIIIRSSNFRKKSNKIIGFVDSSIELISLFNSLNKFENIKLNKIKIKSPIFIPKIKLNDLKGTDGVQDKRLYSSSFFFEWKSLNFCIIFDHISYIDEDIKIGYKINDLSKEKILKNEHNEGFKPKNVNNIDDKSIILKNLKPFVTNKIKNDLFTKRYGFDAIGEDYYESREVLNNYQENHLKNIYEMPGVWFYDKEYMPKFGDFLTQKIIYELELINEIMEFNHVKSSNLIENSKENIE